MGLNDTKFNVRNYTDIQGLASLKGQLKTNPEMATKEVARQFEALMVQMMLKSMRDAGKAFKAEGQHNDAFDMYQDLFDKQISMSVSDFGLAKQIESYLKKTMPTDAKTPPEKSTGAVLRAAKPAAPRQAVEKTNSFTDQKDFINKLWGYAQQAAQLLKLDPKVLLAQAALETNWGKKIISCPEQGSSMNLFNIKADKSWDKAHIQTFSLEEKEGIMHKAAASFRAYPSYEDSFKDYVQFLKNNPRYTKALQQSNDPERYLQSLQEAHYATDSQYKDKIMRVYNSPHFDNLEKYI